VPSRPGAPALRTLEGVSTPLDAFAIIEPKERDAAPGVFDMLFSLPGSATGRVSVEVSHEPLQMTLTAADGGAVELLSTPVKVSGVAVSALAIWWATRAVGLATAVMVSVPTWSNFDPLPILGGERKRGAPGLAEDDAEKEEGQNPFDSVDQNEFARTMIFASESS
jgi:hypothetical protein